MAEIKAEILNNSRKFIDILLEKGISVKSAYLYGSYSNNSFNEMSDIDLAVISDDFEGNILTDIEKFIGLTRKIDSRLSILPLNEESFDSYFIQKEVFEKGIKIY